VTVSRDAARAVRALAAQRARPRFGYVGWLGQANLGDEALFEAHQQALGPAPVFEVPHGWSADAIARFGPRRLMDGLVLGGGTLIGHAGFRRPVETLLRADPGLVPYMLGPGVQDPAYADDEAAAREELERWVPLLRRFPEVLVRGPRSQELLGEVGVDSEVIGDSALLLAPDAVPDGERRDTLGLNIGVHEKVHGGTIEPIVAALIALGRAAVADGRRVCVFSVWPPDTAVAVRVQRAIGAGAELVTEYHEAKPFMTAMNRCRVFVAFKLHAGVLATASGVPSVMLEYNPKCRDFQESIEREFWTVRTDAVDVGELQAMVDDLWDGFAAEHHHVREVTLARRAALTAAAERARKRSGAPQLVAD
jgi:polysaccharide pyruvyl transferase WcaK-like protein